MKKVNKAAQSETKTVDLRKRAEEIARETADQSPEDIDVMSHDEVRQTFHELRVHQIELDMQNEEMRRIQAELIDAQARYFDLYDLAPVGYVTISEKGLILKTNLTAAKLLGVPKGKLMGHIFSRFILKEDQDIYYRHRKQLLETTTALRQGSVQAVQADKSGQAGEPQVFELRMVKKDGTPFWAHLAATVQETLTDSTGSPQARSAQAGAAELRIVLSDITERKRVEETQKQQAEELLARNHEMSRFNLAAVGRELFMIELKREVNHLCGQLGEPPRYRIAKGDATPPDSTEAQA